MDHIRKHLENFSPQRTRKTERGEMMKYFCDRLNAERARDKIPPLTMGRMGKIIQGIPTADLYYLKSVCDKAPNFSKKFWWEIKPKDEKDKIKKERFEKYNNNN